MQSLGPLTLVIFLVPGIALLMALRLFYRKEVVTSANQARLAISLAAWVMIFVAVFGAGIGTLSFLSTIYLPMTLIAILMLIDRFRRSEHHALLNTLAFSAEKGIPLQETARAFAQEHAGDAGVRAHCLAERLEAGATLSEATRVARLRLSTPMRLAVNMSDVLTLRGLTLKSQLNWGNESDAALRTIISRLVYLCVSFVALQVIVIFVMLKILPVFQKMFEEFGLILPAMTQSLVTFSKWMVMEGWLFAIPLLLLGLAAAFVGIVFYSGIYSFPVVPGSQARSRNAMLPDVMRFMDWLFFLRMFFWRYDASLVLRSLSLLLQQHQPLPQALILLANVYPRPNVRRRLTRAAVEVEQGRDWKQALRKQWLVGPAELAVLAAAERAGNLPWALDEMGESLMRRLTYRMMVVYQFVYPALLLSFGLFVGYFAIAMMLPLFALIQGLT
ncbi:type IV pilin biogenesis protein [Anatilimnocola aggregata]|uniref:Type IV pilin biogenesis protein n=1 Tax=Anatilimnocola aggregata TaxID=2528021 RepID=A0A517YI16_9BACT|nr:type II secretion system F family protein [Anatilimnocola aggregata]QDU29855.1 type IV pilin biogenesis protein [Anatilimnocola aggregata]